MSIYIKGMKMPNCCEYCFLVSECKCWHYEVFTVDGGNITRLIKDDCPLTEVPNTHGDLVDHSEIGEILIKALDECEISEADKGHVIRAVWTAPTVIESEVEE